MPNLIEYLLVRTETLEILAEAIALSYPWEVLMDVRGMMFELRMKLGFTVKESFLVFFKALEVSS